LNKVPLLSHDAVVFSTRIQHLCPSGEPAQQLKHFLQQRATELLTAQIIRHMAHGSSGQRQFVESKSTAWCEMPQTFEPLSKLTTKAPRHEESLRN
jgi:hypothetical protein